jgi:predicted O-linked N-acetylglucosamine transferase (SPINDLY family)
MHFQTGRTAAEIFREHRAFNDKFCKGLALNRSSFENDQTPGRRIRIGYVSPNFQHHPVGRFLLPLLKHRDRSQMEVFCYSDVQSPDAFSEQIRGLSDGWRDIRGQSHEQADRLIRSDKIDILVDLCMFMQDHRMLLFARRTAPIQATYLAYCSTTGLDAMDYRISDPFLDPVGTDESCYSERTLRFSNSYWSYEPPSVAPNVETPPATRAGYVTFGCLNGFIKVSAPALQTWSQLLSTVPGSRLILHAHPGSHRQRVLDFLATCRINPSRIEFLPFLRVSQFMAAHHRIDIALDPFPYGGGTTTCDALWMGVPVISMIGDTAVGRGGFSILSNIGLAELVARTPQEYVRMAAELASDLPRLTQLRFSLRDRMRNSPLMNGPLAAKDLEALYRRMWNTWCNNSR